MLNKTDLLSAQKLRVEKVNVRELGGDIYIRVMTGQELDKYYEETISLVDGQVVATQENKMAKLLVKCICDESGNRLFADNEIAQLGNVSSTVLVPLYEAAMRLNNMSGDASKNL